MKKLILLLSLISFSAFSQHEVFIEFSVDPKMKTQKQHEDSAKLFLFALIVLILIIIIS
jgi:hypothetical protein